MEKTLQDNPTTGNYPLDSDATTINYTEGIYVGYRGFEKNQTEPQFPFGFGLSYTTFAYSDLDITPLKGKDHEQPLAKVSFPVSNLENDNDDHDLVKVSFTVINTGGRAGAEIAELYVAPVNPPVDRPIKELKGFQKVFLGPGQSRRITLELDQRSFAFFNTGKNLWDRSTRHLHDPGWRLVAISAAVRPVRAECRVGFRTVDEASASVSVSASASVSVSVSG